MRGWILPPGKIYLSFKTMKNIKIVDPVFTMNSFYDWDDILQKKKWKHNSGSKIRRHSSPAKMTGWPKLNGFFCACRYFFIKCCSARRLTTTDFKELLYLMCFFVFLCFNYSFLYIQYSITLIFISSIRTSKKARLLF